MELEIANQMQFKSALITNVEMKDGSFTKIVTLFNSNEIGFDEINLGVKRALQQTHSVCSMQSEVYSLRGGIPKKFVDIRKSEIKNFYTGK